MNEYRIEFIFLDHESDIAPSREYTIVEARNLDEAEQVFYLNPDSFGCHIQNISLY